LKTVTVDSFEVLVDTTARVIGLRVDPVYGKPYVMPMAYDTANAMAECMIRTLLVAAPEMFADVLKRY
jgi:hypothetical protein